MSIRLRSRCNCWMPTATQRASRRCRKSTRRCRPTLRRRRLTHSAPPQRRRRRCNIPAPTTNDVYVNPFTQPVPLLDANGNPTGFKALREVHTPVPTTNRPPVEVDHFPNTTAQITLQYPGGGTEQVNLSGPTTVNVNIPP